MGSEDFIPKCKELVAKHYNDNDNSNSIATEEDVYVVWSCKTLQNNKALLSLYFSGSMYYELTYNGDKKELYLDAYQKFENVMYNME